MLCYLILNGIYRNYLMADGYETERHFFEGLTAFCRIQVKDSGELECKFFVHFMFRCKSFQDMSNLPLY